MNKSITHFSSLSAWSCDTFSHEIFSNVETPNRMSIRNSFNTYYHENLGIVSLTFRELCKTFPQKLCVAESYFYEDFKLKLFKMCSKPHALGTRTKFQLEVITINVIFGIVYFVRLF